MSIANQKVSISFFDNITNQKGNSIGLPGRKTGIYAGGHLYPISSSTSTCTLSDLVCEIADSGSTAFEQVNVATGAFAGMGANNITVTGITGTNNVIILQWTYNSSAATTLQVSAVAPGSIPTNALIVGSCTVSGSSLVFNYSLRSNPNVNDIFLKVELTESLDSAPMSVRVRGGICNYGVSSFQIADQLTSSLSSLVPGSGTQIAMVQINTSGVVVCNGGGVNVASSSLNYGGLITLAEITLTSGMSTIGKANIKDVRGWVSGATTLSQVYPVGAVYTEITGVNPATTFGFGTWSAFGQGRVLIGAGTSDQTFTAGVTGGESNHTLSIPEMPSHNHTGQLNASPQSGSSTDCADQSGGQGPIYYTTNNTGGGGTHNNLQPYIVVYFWLRTS